MVCVRMLNILNLIDDARCFETVRAMHWPQGVTCPHCHSPQVTKQGHDESQPARQKYECNVCRRSGKRDGSAIGNMGKQKTRLT